MNYSEMSDFEINKKLAELLGYEVATLEPVADPFNKGADSAICAHKDNPMNWIVLDYCNSWSDMGPLISEYKIGVWTHPDFEGKWSARFNIKRGVSIVYDVTQDKNPLRAAAICLLMLLDKGE